MGIYHLKGGVSFEKVAGGRVQILLSDGSGRQVMALAEAEEWASVVAAMSHEGESAETHAAALELHTPAEVLAELRAAELVAAEAADAAAKEAEAKAKEAQAASVAARENATKVKRRVQGGQAPAAPASE